jgi:hypothetical protein
MPRIQRRFNKIIRSDFEQLTKGQQMGLLTPEEI